jgi:hypothetical protein
VGFINLADALLETHHGSFALLVPEHHLAVFDFAKSPDLDRALL